MQRKYFGTDGIRGRVGEWPITPEFVMKLGWAAGRVLANGRRGEIIIGKDTRISGYMFESALEAGLSAAGVDVRLLGPMPTPGIAYLTRSTRALAGIVISASHNPYPDNGIKFFAVDGTKLPDETELAIEAELDRPLLTVSPERLGKARRMADAPRRYIEFCKGTVPQLDLRGLNIVLDCAHGATYHIAPKVFEELGASVGAVGIEPDGLNINREHGATHPHTLQAAVIDRAADLGIAFDGDGDRVIMIDERGEVVDGDELLYIIASARRENLNGAVVGTLMSNFGLEQAIHSLGLDFLRASVGDRFIYEMLVSRGLKLGGESSGHIICMDLSPTGDGIVSALQVLQVMRQRGLKLSELKSGMRKYPQTIINVPFNGGHDPLQMPAVRAAVGQVEAELRGGGRVLLRPSGTEPVLRIMVEGREAAQVAALARRIADAVQEVAAGS